MTYAAELMFNIWAEILPHLTSTKKKKKIPFDAIYYSYCIYTLFFIL